MAITTEDQEWGHGSSFFLKMQRIFNKKGCIRFFLIHPLSIYSKEITSQQRS